MAQEKEPTIYQIVFKGTYYTQNPAEFEPFELTAKLDFEMQQRALSVFKNDLAPTLMPLKYPNFRALRNYYAAECTVISGKQTLQNLDVMTRPQMIAYADNYMDGAGIPLEMVLYDEDEALRHAIKLYQADPESFLAEQAIRVEKEGDRIRRKKAALALNNASPPITVQGPAITAVEDAAAKAYTPGAPSMAPTGTPLAASVTGKKPPGRPPKSAQEEDY